MTLQHYYFKQYAWLGLFISFAGFMYAQDRLVQEYKEYAETIKGNILPRVKLIKDKTEYTRNILSKRLAKIEGTIKKNLAKNLLINFGTGPNHLIANTPIHSYNITKILKTKNWQKKRNNLMQIKT